MENKRKAAIAYIRVSTEEQGSDDKYGIQVQKIAIVKWAIAHGYEVQQVVIEKKSGAKERQKMNEIVFGDQYMNPPYEAVIVYKNDRIARDMKLYFYYEYVLNKKGIELLCVQDDFLNGVDSSVATLYKAMMQFVAEQERKNITMRTSSGRIAKAQNGGYAGGNTPFGYTSKNKKLIINEREAKIVREIFHIYEDLHKSMAQVETYVHLNHPDFVSRNGKPLSYMTIRSIINNKPVYQGLYKYGNMGYIRGEHEAILQEDRRFSEEYTKIMNQIKDEKDGTFFDKTME